MGNADVTLMRLEAAFKRILLKKPTRISSSRKLSVRAVEEEANLGNGSAYYYADFIKKVKDETRAKISAEKTSGDREKQDRLKKQLEKEIRLKLKYKKQIDLQKVQLAAMAAEHNRLSIEAEELKNRLSALVADNIELLNVSNRD